jgi:hypothetical protein
MPGRTVLFMALSIRQTMAPAARIPANSSGPLIDMELPREHHIPKSYPEIISRSHILKSWANDDVPRRAAPGASAKNIWNETGKFP